MATYRGIDVSNWSGTIDWRAVADSGVEVVIIQASEGTFYRDPYLHEYYDGAKAYGLKVGFYHFFNPGSSPTPQEQARYFVDTIRGLDSDLKLILDFEQIGGLDNYELTLQAIEFLREVKEYSGLDTAIYTYTYFAQHYLYEGLGLSEYPLWIAQLSEGGPSPNPIWGDRYVAWQYSDTGRVRGINASTDLDLIYDGMFLDDSEDVPKEQKKPRKIPGDRQQPSTKIFTTTYIVQSGDTLTSIAIRFDTTVQAIVDLNDLENPNLIYVGEILKIPTDSRGNIAVPSTRQYMTTYIVQNGDTLSSIAQKFDTTVQSIVSINNISNPNLIYTGEILKIRTSINTGSRGENFSSLYTVQKGDTLSSIAKKFGVDYKELIEKNNMTNPNLIYVGEVIRI